MRMVDKSLTPGMEYHYDARLSAKVASVLRKSQERLRGSPKKQRIQELLVSKKKRIKDVRHGKDHMEILRIKHFTASLVYPDLFEDRLTVRTASVATGTRMRLSMSALVTDAGVVAKLAGLAL